MEAFRLDRQAKVFLAVLVVLALAMVPLAPFAALAFGALSLVVLCVVFLIALARNRRLFGPLTPAEGALAASSAIFAVSGALVVVYAILMLGAGNAMMLSHAMLPFRSGDGPRAVGNSSVWYSDADTRKALKEALAKAGIPFELETREGKEYVSWSYRHDEAARAINEKLRQAPPSGPASPLPVGRTMSFGDPAHHEEFAQWLARKGVKSETIESHGQRYLVWDEGAGDPRQLMNEFFAEKARRCKEERKTAQAPGAAKCS
jgi:hypothetical protein